MREIFGKAQRTLLCTRVGLFSLSNPSTWHSRWSSLFSVKSAAALDQSHHHNVYCLPGREGNFSLHALFSPLFTTSFLHSRIIWKNVIISCLQSLSTPSTFSGFRPCHSASPSALKVSSNQWNPGASTQFSSFSPFQKHLTQLIVLSFLKSCGFFFFKLGFWILLCWFSLCFTDCPSWVSCVESCLPPPSLKASVSQDPALCLASHSVGVLL